MLKLICVNPQGYQLTEGETYTALYGIEKDNSNDTSWGWRWPDYVTVIDDKGCKVMAHASRFKVIGESLCAVY